MNKKNIKNKITSKVNPQMSTLAVALCASLLASQANAEETTTKSTTLDKVSVEESVTRESNPYAVPGSPYLAERVSDPRRTEKLADTPATITVVTAEAIKESGKTDLKEILDGQPGITLGTGENGNAFGDRYVIRGHEARSDMFADGLRDPGMTIRESFAVDQVEISKGPSSTFAGRGTTGGAVNLSTKRASTESDFGEISTGVGTDSYHRVTLDYNHVINEDTAVRANILTAGENVPDREPADRERTGAALSLTHKATDNLEFTTDYYHFSGKDNPDLGTYLTDSDGDGLTNNPVKDLPTYLQDEDFLESTVDTFTLRTGYEIDSDSRIVNLTRVGKTENGYLATGARGTTGYATEADATAGTNGYDTYSFSTHQGWQEVEYFADQLNYMKELEIANMEHKLVFGTEYTRQSVENGVYNISANGTTNCYTVGRNGTASAGYCGTDSSGNTVSNLNSLLQRSVSKGDWDSKWDLNTISTYAMDTVELTDDFTAFGGVRFDHYDYNLDTPTSEYDYNKGDWNGHVGISYKITPSANVYATYSTATNLNGEESDVGTNGGYGGFIDAGDNVDVEPETTNSYEIGTKWKFNDDKLLATAAIFRIDKSDVMESQGDYSTTGSANTGANRVEGIEFGLAGYITEKLSLQGGVTFMNAEVTDSYSDANIGRTLANFADKSLNIQARYHLTPALTVGGAATYESERYTGQPDSAASTTMYVPAYTVYDAFATYKIDSKTSLRLNVNNVFDTDYYLAAYRSGAFTYIGDKRNAELTLTYKF